MTREPYEHRGRPRILVIGPGPGGAGGIAVVIETLVASPLAERFQLVVVSTHSDSRRTGKAVRGITGIAHAAWLLATRQVDLLYVHTSSGFSFRRKAAVAAIARSAHRPYVVHVHAADFDGYFRAAPRWERWLVRRTLTRAALVIALSPSWERRLQALVPFRSKSIPNPVAIPTDHARLGTSPARIVCLGRLGARKGSRTLVRALAMLDGPHSDVRLILAGDGDRAWVRSEAHRLGVSDRVELPGWVGPDERARTLLAASVFALPAREEGLPVSLLEAMAYGLPSVVSPVGGIPDAFEEGRHGYFVPPDDPEALAERLRMLLDDPDAAREMGRQARRDAQARFAVGVVATQVGDALEAALGRRGNGAAGRRHEANSTK